MAAASGASSAATNTLTVTNTNAPGAGSPRQATADAAGGDIVSFSPSAGSVIMLTGGELLVNKSLNIDGPGASAAPRSGRARPRPRRASRSRSSCAARGGLTS